MKDFIGESLKMINTNTGCEKNYQSIFGENNIDKKYPIELQLKIRLPEEVIHTMVAKCERDKTDLISQIRQTLIRSAAHSKSL